MPYRLSCESCDMFSSWSTSSFSVRGSLLCRDVLGSFFCCLSFSFLSFSSLSFILFPAASKFALRNWFMSTGVGDFSFRFASRTFLAMSFPSKTAALSEGLSGLMEDVALFSLPLWSRFLWVAFERLGGLMDDDEYFLVTANFLPLNRSALLAASALKEIKNSWEIIIFLLYWSRL